jgi:hypothetical protein
MHLAGISSFFISDLASLISDFYCCTLMATTFLEIDSRNGQNLATNCSRIGKMSRYGKCCSKIPLKNVLFPQKIKETSNIKDPPFFWLLVPA